MMPGHFVLICDLGINPAQASLRIGTVNMLVRNPEEEKKEKEKVNLFLISIIEILNPGEEAIQGQQGELV